MVRGKDSFWYYYQLIIGTFGIIYIIMHFFGSSRPSLLVGVMLVAWAVLLFLVHWWWRRRQRLNDHT